MKRFLLCLVLLVCPCSLFASEPASVANAALNTRSRSEIFQYSPEIEPYVSFLKNHAKNPVDYILELFEKYDIIVLATTDHREINQWDFFYTLTSDKRFRTRVGNVFSEDGGSIKNQQEVDSFLDSKNCDSAKVLGILRDYVFFPEGWKRPNIFDYLTKVWRLNENSSPEERIRFFLTDVYWDWNDIKNKEEYDKYMASISTINFHDKEKSRDNIAAENIACVFKKKLFKKKALVFFNTRHAYKRNTFSVNGRELYLPSVAARLSEKFPGKVASLMMNFVGAVRNGQTKEENPTQGGKWDAAFKVMQNIPMGFDLGNSPFGKDNFDYFAELGGVPGITYENIFDGMIFWRPLSEFTTKEGINGFWDDKYKQRVSAIFEKLSDSKKAKEILDMSLEELNKITTETPYNKDEFSAKIEKWLICNPR
ncbi:MAG: hypothetical protein HQM08_20725 [Candidatus Riflebacteria bacterium]|nr:hypothetical protein [Candidatus Riflebacteria bacterium]